MCTQGALKYIQKGLKYEVTICNDKCFHIKSEALWNFIWNHNNSLISYYLYLTWFIAWYTKCICVFLIHRNFKYLTTLVYLFLINLYNVIFLPWAPSLLPNMYLYCTMSLPIADIQFMIFLILKIFISIYSK